MELRRKKQYHITANRPSSYYSYVCLLVEVLFKILGLARAGCCHLYYSRARSIQKLLYIEFIPYLFFKDFWSKVQRSSSIRLQVHRIHPLLSQCADSAVGLACSCSAWRWCAHLVTDLIRQHQRFIGLSLLKQNKVFHTSLF